MASRSFAAQLGDRVNIYPVKGYSITVNLRDEASQAGASNVFYNTGHGHLGLTLSAITADMVAHVVAGAKP